MKKKTVPIVLLLIFCLACTMTGCTYTAEAVEQDTETPTLETNFETGQTSVTDEIEVNGEPFSLVCTYNTDCPLDNWRVTSNKNISMSVTTKGLPEGYSAHIEHMHADIILKSTAPSIDGITQDTMDDTDHRVPTAGFPISDTVAYHNIFSIEGYTDQFYKLWGYAFGTYGTMSSSYERLTEYNIRKVGTYAEKLAIVYDVVISTPDCEEGYVKSVSSELLIPLTSEIKTVQKDFWTDAIIEESTETQGE